VGVINASVAAQLGRRFELQLTATNLTDKTYYCYHGTSDGPSEAYPALPFQVLTSLCVRVGQ
jgi:outer membrane receptor protein involved in Fe transport